LSRSKRNGLDHHAHSFEEHWITLDGARMRYLRSGVGPPLLLVHGLLGYSFSWRFAIPSLADQATVYAVDMLGVGFSDRPPGLDCCLRASAERLLRFLDTTAVVSCDLLGTSHGGAVAMMAAALAPDRIRRLILVAPVNPWSAHGKVLAQVLSNRLISALLVVAAPFLKVTHSQLLRRLYGDTSRIRPGTLEGYSEPFEKPGALQHNLGILRSWQRDLADLEAILPNIANIPALLIWGARDAAVDPASATRLSRVFNDCRIVMLEGVGHLPYEEVPEEFNTIVKRFLEQTTAVVM
jgi:pimeloyl-ACP methyl ester carboxylesterase